MSRNGLQSDKLLIPLNREHRIKHDLAVPLVFNATNANTSLPSFSLFAAYLIHFIANEDLRNLCWS